MDIAEMFLPGMRVELTPKGIQQGLVGNKGRRVGTVVGVTEHLVRVRKIGESRVGNYHPTFWRPIRPEAAIFVDWLLEHGYITAAEDMRRSFL